MTLEALHPIVAITQARVGSTRLPGKVLRPMAGRPMLEWHLARLKRARRIDAIVVATTHEGRSDEIEAIASRLGIAVVRGSERDVLARFDAAARLTGAKTIIRMTSDCPLIDPELIDQLIGFHAERAHQADYTALDVSAFPRGLDCEIVSRVALDEAAERAILPDDREHVTRYIRRRARFEPGYLAPRERSGEHRWCVDTAEDFALVEAILQAAGSDALSIGWRDIARLVDRNAGWRSLNAHIRQKVA